MVPQNWYPKSAATARHLKRERSSIGVNVELGREPGVVPKLGKVKRVTNANKRALVALSAGVTNDSMQR